MDGAKNVHYLYLTNKHHILWLFENYFLYLVVLVLTNTI